MNKISIGFLFLITGILGSEKVLSQTIPFGFFRVKADKLAFTTAAQTIFAGNCSGITTVQNQSGGGAAKNVASNLTVDLAVIAGVTYYSDANCTASVTSVVIATGTSSKSFYYISDTIGTKSVSASTVSGLLATQDQVINTNPYVWTGGGSDANWNTGANWSGGTAPSTTSHIALFDSTSCPTNCSPTVNVAISIGGIRLSTGYGGTVTQGAGNTITLGTGGWSQLDGTFTGAASTITLNGPWAVVNGTFTSTSGTITANNNWNLSGTGVFANAGGAVTFSTSSTRSMIVGTARYNHFSFNSCGGSFDLSSGTLIVDGTLTFSGGCGAVSVNSGTIMAYGNVGQLLSGGVGSVILTIAGNASGQTITGLSMTTYFPTVVIAAGANNVTLSGTIQISGSYTVTSVGALTTTGSTLAFSTSSARTMTPGAYHYNNVTIGSCGGSYDLGGGTFNIDGTLTLSGGCSAVVVNSGTIMAYGDVTQTLAGGLGSVVITIAGNASGQTVTGISSTSYFPNLVIAAGANPVTFSGTIVAYMGLTFTSAGSFTTTGSTLIMSGGAARTMVPGPFHYNNVTFAGCGAHVDLSGGTLYVDGTLTFAAGCSGVQVSNGIIAAAGNVTTSGNGASTGGTAQLQFVGATDQTVTVAAGNNLPGGNITIATTAGAFVNFASAVSWNVATQTVTVTSGDVNMAGFAWTVKALSLNGTSVIRNGGALTVNGTLVGPGTVLDYGGTINP